MSSDTDADAAATLALYNVLYSEEYCVMAASVLFIYDTFVTLDREVACFWTDQRTGASFLFFANKWISMMLYILVLVEFSSFSSCSSFAMAEYAIGVLQFLPGAAFSSLRAYVLSRSKLLGMTVFALSLAPVGANLVDYGFRPSGENFPPFGCFFIDNITASLSLRFGSSICDHNMVIISRVPLITADILLIYITWAKLSSSRALRGIRQFTRPSLSDVLFRGGTVYFVVFFALNVLHLVFSATAIATDSAGSYMPIFTAPLTAISISRFLLDLQEANLPVVRLEADGVLYSSRSPWDDAPSFISSLGTLIAPGLTARSDDGFELHVVQQPN